MLLLRYSLSNFLDYAAGQIVFSSLLDYAAAKVVTFSFLYFAAAHVGPLGKL